MKHFILSLFLLISATAFSKEIYQKTAYKVACNFYAQQGGDTTNGYLIKKDSSLFYFGYAKGFVIVRKFDQLRPIAGYSTEGAFKTNPTLEVVNQAQGSVVQRSKTMTIPPAREWEGLQQGRQTVKASTVVPPFVGYRLNQDRNFWDSMGICKGHNQMIYTGCGPTVATGISLYYGYPKTGTGAFTYNDAEGGVRSCDFSKRNYDYTGIPYTFTSPNKTVCQLMRDYGVAMEAQLGCLYLGGTAVYGIGRGYRTCEYAYINNFGFKPTMEGVFQSNSPTVFEAKIRASLEAGKPVQLFIYSQTSGGHTVIIDGVDGNGLFHILFGWGTAGVGYYSLNTISVLGYTFNTGFSALTGIEPTGPYTPPVPPVIPPVTPTTCLSPTALKTTAIANTTATVAWDAGTGNDKWKVQYITYDANGSGSYKSVNVTSPTATLTGLTPNSKYYWTLYPYCGTKALAGINGTPFTTLAGTTPPPVPPTPTCNPTSNLTAKPTTVLNWAAVQNATYNVKYTAEGLTVSTTSTSNTITVNGCVYSFSVQTNCNGVLGAWVNYP